MQYAPHDYQAHATRFIIERPEAALFLDMGLGKTVITLTALAELLFDRFEISRVLVVAPLRVARDTWPAEVAKWEHLAHLRVSVVVGTELQRRDALAAEADIYVINRENVDWLTNQDYPAFDMCVIDELSSFKNHASKRFRAMRRLRPSFKRIVGLTGTPATNGLGDLWAQFKLLDDGQRLTTHITRFRNRWFTPDKTNGHQVYSWRPRAGAEEEIYEAISDITVSMRSADHLDLPALTTITQTVAMTAAEKAVYDQLRADLVLELDGQIIDAANAAVLSGKLHQLAAGAVLGEDHTPTRLHDRKLDALEDLVEAANGQPLLVAHWFRHDLDRIRARLPQARLLDTAADMAAWNAGEIPVGLLHPASAGHGLNLQAGGSVLVWFSLPWSLELYQQTNARLHRQGQTKPVVIYHLITAGTIERQVLASLEAKDITQTALIEAVKTTLEES